VQKTLKTSVCTEDVFCLLKLLESCAGTTFSAFETFPLPAPPIAKQEDLGSNPCDVYAADSVAAKIHTFGTKNTTLRKKCPYFFAGLQNIRNFAPDF